MRRAPRRAPTRRERARDAWDAVVGPHLRRAADPELPPSVAVLELLRAAFGLRTLGVDRPEDLDAVVDQAAPGTSFRREARLAVLAARLRRELDRYPSWSELLAAERGLAAGGTSA